jgi:putative hydrolase of the HAD superfamily
MTSRAVLFDLDDTLIFAYSNPAPAWRAVVAEFADRLGHHDASAVGQAVADSTQTFLSDDDNRRLWRLQAVATRRAVVRDALDAAGFTGLDAVAGEIADRYADYREENMYLYPDALTVIDSLRQRGIRLGLVTNGATEVQHAKIDRFDLRRRFDHIQVEEEAGFGKPDGRAYVHTLAALDVAPEQTTMIGDDLVWDVLAPQRLGITGIWYDSYRAGLPPHVSVRPDRIIHTLKELLSI